MHLSPKKGAYPHKDQHDRTCVVASDNEANLKIERGMVIRVTTDGRFEVAEDASQFPLYLALQNYDDLQANMAGFFGAGAGPVDRSKLTPTVFGAVADVDGVPPSVGPKGPAITGYHMDDGDVWQTDMFDPDSGITYEIGQPLTVDKGYLTNKGADDTNTVGYVTATPYPRYANDATVPGMEKFMTGATIQVIDFQCGK